MDKKTLFSGLLCGLVIGTGLGYMGGSSPAEKSDDEASLSNHIQDQQKRAPRFGESRKNNLAEAADKGKGSVTADAASVDALLVKYSRMNPDQIKEELDKLYKQDVDRSFDIKNVLASFFLNYKWGQTSPKQALEYARAQGTMGSFSSSMIIRGWADANPEAAAAYLLENKKDFPMGKECLRTIAETMGKTSPDLALKWMASLEGLDKQLALPSLMGGIAREYPEKLGEYVKKLNPDLLDNRELCNSIARNWASRDWDSTKSWIDSLPGERKDDALASALGSLCKTDPDKALQEFGSLTAEQKEKTQHHIVNALAEKNSVKALEWLKNNFEEEKSLSMVDYAIRYDQCSSSELKDYVSRLQEGSLKDAALESIVRNSSYQAYSSYIDYENTLSLSEQIKSERKRNESTDRLLNSWVNTEPEKAKQWVANSQLSEKKKQDFINRCEERLKNKKSGNIEGVPMMMAS